MTNEPKRIPSEEPCVTCHHRWDDHLLHGEGPAPKSGWMTCPVEGCTCRKTWSFEGTPPPAA